MVAVLFGYNTKLHISKKKLTLEIRERRLLKIKSRWKVKRMSYEILSRGKMRGVRGAA